MTYKDFVGNLNESRLIIYRNKIIPKVNIGILQCEFQRMLGMKFFSVSTLLENFMLVRKI